MIFKKDNRNFLYAPITTLYKRTSLTIKAVALTVIIGLSLWALLDYAQSSKLNKIFYIQLFDKLSEQAMEDRLRLDRYIKSFRKLADLMTSQKDVDNYVKNQNWSPDKPFRIKFYHKPPSWFPKPSLFRLLANPRYTFLLDAGGNVREVFLSHRGEQPHPALLHPSAIILLKSHEQSYIASIDNAPYLIASEPFVDSDGKKLATLMLASPIDEEFLSTSIGTRTPWHLVALISSDQDPYILTSSNLVELPSGTPLSSLRERYLVTGQEAFDYGSAEYYTKLVTFMSMKEADSLTSSVISTGRYQRNIIAPVFILTFAFIMLWVTRRINRLNIRMSDFSQQTLGGQKKDLQKGDQLFVLENRFQLLTKEVLEARELLKKQAEEKTSLIVNNAFDAIITMDDKGAITTWNPKAEVIFGWTRDQAVGRITFDTIIPRHYIGRHEQGIKYFLSVGKGPLFYKQFQITARHRDGHEFPVELSISPARSEESYIFIAIIRDITERVKAEEELAKHRIHLRQMVKERTTELKMSNEQLQKEIIKHKEAEERKAQLLAEVESINQELKNFAYIVSHDLKAPLRAIGSLANWISTDYADKLDEEGKDQLDMLIGRVHRMNALINGILEYSRVGRVKEEKVRVNLIEIVTEAIEMIAPPENIEITVKNKLPAVICERTRILEVFQNLLSNAVRYIDKPEGMITIACAEDNGFWRFSVSDNGQGIDEKYFEKIFQIFQTLAPSETPDSTGVGLTLVKKIITMYGGKIWVESEPGKGSTFFFTLPKE